jgi:hypothetical protein
VIDLNLIMAVAWLGEDGCLLSQACTADGQLLFWLGNRPESIATLPPFGPIEGHSWFFQISSQ